MVSALKAATEQSLASVGEPAKAKAGCINLKLGRRTDRRRLALLADIVSGGVLEFLQKTPGILPVAATSADMIRNFQAKNSVALNGDSVLAGSWT